MGTEAKDQTGKGGEQGFRIIGELLRVDRYFGLVCPLQEFPAFPSFGIFRVGDFGNRSEARALLDGGGSATNFLIASWT